MKKIFFILLTCTIYFNVNAQVIVRAEQNDTIVRFTPAETREIAILAVEHSILVEQQIVYEETLIELSDQIRFLNESNKKLDELVANQVTQLRLLSKTHMLEIENEKRIQKKYKKQRNNFIYSTVGVSILAILLAR